MNSNKNHLSNKYNHTHQFKYVSHSNSDIPNNVQNNNNHTVYIDAIYCHIDASMEIYKIGDRVFQIGLIH